MQKVEEKYNSLCNTSSDINEHLPILFKYAKECETIIECGVRGCVSSWALVFGLLNNNSDNKQILLNDKYECDINELLNKTNDLPIIIHYQWINNLDLQLTNNYDIVFIDTWHVYGHLKRELTKFGPIINKYIIMHDTTIDEIDGETIRCGWNTEQQSQDTGYPVE